VDVVIAEGHLVPNDDLTLSFMVRGKVAEILVEKGRRCAKGTCSYAWRTGSRAEAALAAAQLELATAQQAYDEFVRTEGLGRSDAWQAYMDAQILRAAAERKWEALNLDNIEEDIEDAQADVTDRLEDLEEAQEEFDKYGPG
jgi:multidrug efflux pump subunit AcrA (membrane-fusion protein)